MLALSIVVNVEGEPRIKPFYHSSMNETQRNFVFCMEWKNGNLTGDCIVRRGKENHV